MTEAELVLIKLKNAVRRTFPGAGVRFFFDEAGGLFPEGFIVEEVADVASEAVEV